MREEVKPFKIAIVTSHPIQYQTPLFQLIARDSRFNLTVYFCWDFGVREAGHDPEFGRAVRWDIPLLEGYHFRFLKNLSPKPSSGFWGQVNFGIVQAIIKGHYDAVILFGWNSFTNLLALISALASGTKVLLRSENPLTQELRKSRIKLMLKRITLPLFFVLFHGFLYIGTENKKFYEYYGASGEKLFFSPYSVDNERFIKSVKKARTKKDELRDEFGIDRKNVVVLFVGKLSLKKRPNDLLSAFEHIPTKKASLIFVGSGPLEVELSTRVRNRSMKNVYFVGFKNQTELPSYYAMADIFVLPSGDGETWGLVVNEAMCAGLPVIVSDAVGCASDLVREGENGALFPVGDVKSLTNKLSALIASQSTRERFSKASRVIVSCYSYREDVEGTFLSLRATARTKKRT